jgi:hypothetical protein
MDSIVLDSQLKVLFKEFAHEVTKIMGNNLKSIIIYGSVSLGDFRRGKGDIDFVCITKNDLTDNEITKIIELHDNIRGGSLGELGVQLEGAYYTVSMVSNIKKNTGRGYYMGTSRRGWKEVSAANSLNYMDILMMINHGIVIAGEENKDYFREPIALEIREEFIKKLQDYIGWAIKTEDIWLSIEMVYFAVRGLNTVLTGNLLSKSEACQWYCQTYPQSQWTKLVEYTSQFRYPMTAQEESSIDKTFIMTNAILFLGDINDMSY